MSVLAFNLGIDRFLDEDVPREVGKLARLVAIVSLNKVVLKSPVDTGRFRGGWIATIETRTDAAPSKSDVKAGSRGKATRAAAASNSVLNEGLAVIAGAKPYEAIILQNNVEYAEALEDGGSDQAPRGILAITVAEIEASFR